MYKKKYLNLEFLSPIYFVMAFLLGAAIVVFPGRPSMALGIGMSFFLVFFALLVSDRDYDSIQSLCFIVGLLYIASVVMWPRYGSLPFSVLPIRNPRRALFAISLAVAISAIMLSRNTRGRLCQLFNTSRETVALLVFYILWRILSLISAIDFYSSLSALLFELVGVFSALIIWSVSINNSQSFGKFLRILLVATLFGGFLVIVEGIKGRNLYLDFLSIDPGESAYFSFLFDRTRDGVYRAQGAFEHPLLLTEFIVFMLPIAVAAFFDDRHSYMRYVWLVVAFTLLVSAYFVRSRSAFLFIGIVFAIGIFLMVVRNLINGKTLIKWLIPTLLILPFATTLFFVIPYVVDVVTGATFMERLSSATRLLMIQRGVPIVLDNIVFGIGPGAAPVALGIYNSQGLPICDNYYLQIAMESGLPALLFFCLFWFFALGRSFFVLIVKPTENGSAIQFGVFVGVVGILIFKFIMAETQNFEFLFLGFVGLLVVGEEDKKGAVVKPT